MDAPAYSARPPDRTAARRRPRYRSRQHDARRFRQADTTEDKDSDGHAIRPPAPQTTAALSRHRARTPKATRHRATALHLGLSDPPGPTPSLPTHAVAHCAA
jgi:hypothetical protein